MKITTLIPAYKPKYLVELLTCLRHQTVKPARIIVSDDSPDQAFVQSLEAEPLKSVIADLNVVVVPGPRNGAYNNFLHLLKVWNGETELFHFLLDDDVIYPPFYERHLQAHASARIQCSISRRWTALESGQPIRDLPVPPAIETHGLRMLALDPEVLFSTTVALSSNWLGELSNAVFSAQAADIIRNPEMDSIRYTGLEDLGAFLAASLRAPVGYINDHLGYFRTSGQQNSADPMGRPMKLAHLAYLALAIAGRRVGKLSAEQTAQCLAQLAPLVVQRYGNQPDMAEFCAVMPALAEGSAQGEAAFLESWQTFTDTIAAGAPQRAPERAPIDPGRGSKISVFIPVYNGEKYIAKTLESALAQTHADFEILCIDDCSTDGSLALVEAIAAKDARVRVLKTPSNMGAVPKVLNLMLPEMRGDYFVYSSQDDLFSPDWLERMYERAVETGADAVLPELVFYYESQPERNRSLVGLRGDRSVQLSGRDAAFHSLDWTIPGNALWNAALIKRIGFADFAMNSDEYSARVFFMNCNKVVFSQGQFLYRQDNELAVTKKIGFKTFDMPYTFLQLYLLLKENGFPPEVCGREVMKGLHTYNIVNQWLTENRATLPAAHIQEAESRNARFHRCMAENNLYELFQQTEPAAA